MRNIRKGARSKRLRRWLCAVLCAGALGLPAGAAAEEPALTEVDRCGSDVEPGGTNLATALVRGGRITFRCGGPATIRITRQHAPTRSVDIDGGNQITLDGNNETALLLVTGPTGLSVTVRLANLTIRRMAHPAGTMAGVFQGVQLAVVNSHISESQSPIIVSRQLLIEGSTFESNRGVLINGNDVDLVRTTIRSNSGPPLLGFGGVVTIADSLFEGNVRSILLARSGTNCSLRIVRTRFVNNRSTAPDLQTPPGGGAFLTRCRTEIDNGIFSGNSTSGPGGAILIGAEAPEVIIRGSRFEDNSAAEGGGAIAIAPALSPRRLLKLQYTILSRNRAKMGGAVFTGQSPENDLVLEGQGVTFADNVASVAGGAIAGWNTTLRMSRGVFRHNEASMGGAVWLNMLAARESQIVNTLFVLNKSPGGTFVGNTTRFTNTTVVGSKGPGLVQAPAFTGNDPARGLRLANSIVENNSGGNCRPGRAGIVDDGSNLQFPDTSCGAGIKVAAALLDTFYAPIVGGPARAQGNDALCQGADVQARDLYGEKRPKSDRCSIGAVEGDLERLLKQRLAAKPDKPDTPSCPPGSTGSYPQCGKPNDSKDRYDPKQKCPSGSAGHWPDCGSEAGKYPTRPKSCRPGTAWWPQCKVAGRCGPGMVGIPPYCIPREAVPDESTLRNLLQQYEGGRAPETRRRY